jgi:GAF domain-containing protein
VTRATVVLRELMSLLRRGGGSPDERITRALALVVEQLDMRTAIVSRFYGGRRIITHVAGQPLPGADLLSMPAEETICHLVAAGEVGPLVTDTKAHPVLDRHGHVEAYSIGAWVGVPLVLGGHVTGVLCAMSPVSRPDLTERDAALLATVGEYVAEVLGRARAPRGEPDQAPAEALHEASGETSGEASAGTRKPPVVPAPRAYVDLPDVATILAAGTDLEAVTRPVLELVHELTGLESTFLTVIDWAGDRQQVRYALNSGDLRIPEGLRTPWADTLCRRSLNEGRPYTRDVPEVWGDSDAARDLGIQTYVSVPLRDGDDLVVGTLCGTSSDRVELDERALHSMRMFARLLSAQLQQEAARAALAERAERLEAAAARAAAASEGESAGAPAVGGRDPLTGLLTRAGVGEWLRSVVPGLRPGLERLAVGWVDAHPLHRDHARPGGPGLPLGRDHARSGDPADPADDWEAGLAEALLGVGRPGDLHGRAGDAFVLAAVLPAGEAGLGGWRDRLSYVVTARAAASHLRSAVGVAATDDPGADPEALLREAAAAAARA